MKQDNPMADTTNLLNFSKRLDNYSKHFWFFDNTPTQYDIEVSNAKKHLKKHVEKINVSDNVIYYDDPLDRLDKYRMTYRL